MQTLAHSRPRWSRAHIMRMAQHALDVLIALPFIAALAVLSPLLRPRGAIVHPRYRCVGGTWCKTFLPEDQT